MNTWHDMRIVRGLAVLLLATTLTGCVTTTVKSVGYERVETLDSVPENELLDVGIRIFDPNIPAEWEEREAANILPDVRRAEARYMPQILKSTLESSGNWGAVRVLPRDTSAVDLMIGAIILESDGERLELEVMANDATGREWLHKKYTFLTSKYAYDEQAPSDDDPFQPLYSRVANDLLAARQALSQSDRLRIRQIAEMRFAEEFAPEAFSGFVEEDRIGHWELVRLPAENDPMLTRIRSIREREYLFIDTLDEYYGEFRRDMSDAYLDYRRFTFEEAINLRELQAQSRRRAIAGAVLAIGGLAAAIASDNAYVRDAGTIGVIAGGVALKSAFDKNAESKIHVEALRELGTSLEAEVAPQVIELDDRTITLTGTVDEQYDAWRDILRDLYRTEVGLPVETATTEPVAAAGPGS